MASDPAPWTAAAGARLRDLVGVVGVVLALSVAARITVPLPGSIAPFTLQTLAVVLAAPIAGLGPGLLGVTAYLAMGAAGLPVFADGRGGLEALTGPTAGFLLAFLLCAPIPGLARSRLGPDDARAWFAVLLGTHLAILVLGFGWLAISDRATGLPGALWALLPGALLKSMIGTGVLRFVLPVVPAPRGDPS